jgi:hypothetical protein
VRIFYGATTFSITKISIMILSIKTFNIMTLSIKFFAILNITTFSKNDSQQNSTSTIMMNVIVLNVAFYFLLC